jgi:4-amino-4-deoxy-L-arabinose transferase-like glycosyltransferase
MKGENSVIPSEFRKKFKSVGQSIWERFKSLSRMSFDKKIGIYKFKFNFWIFLILLLCIFVNFYNLTNKGITTFDEGDYLNAARLVLEGDLRKLGSGFKFVHNLIIVIFFSIFGIHDYVAFASSAFFSLFTVYLIFLIGSMLFDDKTGLLAALTLTVTEYFIYFSRSGLADGHMMFFFTLTIFVYLSGLSRDNLPNLITTGLLAGICYATKNVGALVLVVIILIELLLLLIKKRSLNEALKRIFVIVFFFLLVVVPIVTVVNLFARHKDIAKYKTVERIYDIIFRLGQYADFYFYFWFFLKLSSLITVVLFMLGFTKAIVKRTLGDKVILVWFLFLYIFLSLFPQHRMNLFVILLPAVVLFVARGLLLFKRKEILTLILALLIFFSLSNAWNTITMTSLGYKKTAEAIIKDNGKGVITTNHGQLRFYLRSLPLKTVGFDENELKDLGFKLDNVTLISILKKLRRMGYSHLVLDWRGGVSKSMGWYRVRNFKRDVVTNVEPIAVVKNNNLEVDEMPFLYREWFTETVTQEEIEEFLKWADEDYRRANNITDDMLVYNDKYRRFTGWYFLRDDPCKDKIYIFRLSDVIEELGE